MMVKEKRPEQVVHLGAGQHHQLAAVKFWQKMGRERIISRELSLGRDRKIRQNAPTWSWKSLCTARCALRTRAAACCQRLLQPPRPQPGHLHQRLPLELRHARRRHRPHHGRSHSLAAEDGRRLQLRGRAAKAEQAVLHHRQSGQRHPKADKVYLIEEAGRPGQLMPIMEDEHGTYIMNSRTCARWSMARLRRSVSIGAQDRRPHQSLYYVARTAGAPPRHRRRRGRAAPSTPSC